MSRSPPAHGGTLAGHLYRLSRLSRSQSRWNGSARASEADVEIASPHTSLGDGKEVDLNAKPTAGRNMPPVAGATGCNGKPSPEKAVKTQPDVERAKPP